VIQLLRFSVVGAVGFCVDALVLYALLSFVISDPYLARIPSFLCAATTTWLLNRNWTFSTSAHGRRLNQWGVYTLAMLSGAATNYACYVLVVLALPAVALSPLLGLVVGSLAGLSLNYTLARNLIFSYGSRRD
jgi:putative flippase GtrA